MAGEIFVVIRACGHLKPRRSIFVTLQQSGNVIGPLLLILREDIEDEPRKAAFVAARLGDQRKVRREHAIVGRTPGLLVGVWRGKMIGWATGTLEHFALLVRSVGDLVLGGDRLGLRGREPGSDRKSTRLNSSHVSISY